MLPLSLTFISIMIKQLLIHLLYWTTNRPTLDLFILPKEEGQEHSSQLPTCWKHLQLCTHLFLKWRNLYSKAL